jgi:hypothetical protein
MQRLRGWSRAPAAVRLAVVTALLAACGTTGVNYVRSGDVAGSDAQLFIKVPQGWKLFDEEEFLTRQSEGLTEEQVQLLRDRQWLVVFDAAPDPSIDHLAPDADHPAGFAQIRQLSATETDYSVESLNSEVFPYSELRFQDGFELIGKESLEDLPGELEGNKLSYSFELEGIPVRVTQLAALDQTNRIIYLTVVACKQSCYEDQRVVIEQLISSWTVEGGL